MAAASSAPLGRRLDAEWAQLVTSPAATRAVARWALLEPVIAGHTSLEQLRGTVHNRGDLDTGDRVLAALVRLAAVTGHGDTLAARVVLQLLLPGAVRLGHTLAPQLGADPLTREALVFSELTIGVRTYPWQRRPRRVAANLLLDTRQRLTRRAGRAQAELPVGLVRDHPPLATPAWQTSVEQQQLQLEAHVTLEHLLWWARRRKIIDAQEQWLLLAHYRDETPISQLAQTAGLSRSTAFALRAGAEQRLRAAVTGEPAEPAHARAADPSRRPGAPDQAPAASSGHRTPHRPGHQP